VAGKVDKALNGTRVMARHFRLRRSDSTAVNLVIAAAVAVRLVPVRFAVAMSQHSLEVPERGAFGDEAAVDRSPTVADKSTRSFAVDSFWKILFYLNLLLNAIASVSMKIDTKEKQIFWRFLFCVLSKEWNERKRKRIFLSFFRFSSSFVGTEKSFLFCFVSFLLS
jgi:hypothetical protein